MPDNDSTPQPLTLTFRRERETKNTVRYEEVSAMPSVVGTLYLQKCVDVRVIPQPNVQVIHHWAPAILSTPSHLLAPVDARR
jgi:hypothetical protein